MKLRALLFAGCCVAVTSSAHAGLLTDDQARKQIQQLEARISTQSSALIDLQTQLDALKSDMRTLRGQNEELSHGLQDAEKRQKDFYIDLDTRLRRFEAVDNAEPIQPAAASGVGAVGTMEQAGPVYDPAVEDRAYEAAYAFLRAKSYQNAVNSFEEFLKKFPDSIFVPNVHYWLGESYFGLQDYKSALKSYQEVPKNYSYSPKTPDALLGMAGCQQELKSIKGAKKTLKQLISKYPKSDAAGKAKSILKTLK